MFCPVRKLKHTVNKVLFLRDFCTSGEEWTKAYFDEKTGGFAEKAVGEMLAKKNGKQVEFLPEGWKKQPDVSFDGKTWDIKYIDNANEETIRAAIRDARKADNAIFYFTLENKYLLLNKAIERETGRFLKGQISELPDIYVIDKSGLLKLIWEKTKRGK
jgi:hypothetical protein